MNAKLLNDILNRRPGKWGNLTVKEFERDISLLTNTVLELQKRLGEEESKAKYYINKWVESTVDNIQMMDEYIPEWRLHAKKEIKELNELLENEIKER